MSRSTRALVIDDEPDICELLSMTLEAMQIETTSATTLADARKALANQSFDVCLTDMRLPDGDGLELLEWIRQNKPALPVAMITAHGSVETAVHALKLGAFDFLAKPIDVTNLRQIVAAAVRMPNSDETGQFARDRLVGMSTTMLNVRDVIQRVARSQAPVHICGESGTGKELVARMIHESGPRAGEAFVPVNCGAIPSELMESELFGHRKGSFTGAVADKLGLIASANGGTLFLDEIADLPLSMQVKLLRVIQEKSLRPVGAEQERSVDVRILSATHQRLADRVRDNAFREDLYYRINVIEVTVPPLRDRGQDVLELASMFLRRLSRQHGGARRFELATDAEKALLEYPFPGNVRELENILERAVTLSANEEITAADLNLRSAAPTEDDPTTAGELPDQLKDVERQAIIDALEQTRYNKTQAAKLLGLSFRQLRYRIKKLGIDS
ncbi:MAG: sigma-54 dependent transcriptional regulator [Pseudomonadota bacterium]